MFELSTQLKKKQAAWKQQKKALADEGTMGNFSEARIKEHKRALDDRNWVAEETQKYIQTTPVAQQTAEQSQELLRKLDAKAKEDSAWELRPVEKLQILDCRPSSPAEVYLMVEKCQERFNEEMVAELLSLIDEHLPRPIEEDEDEDADDDDEEEEGAEEEDDDDDDDDDDEVMANPSSSSSSSSIVTGGIDAGMHPADQDDDDDEMDGEEVQGGGSSKKAFGYSRRGRNPSAKRGGR
jgi:hypothetical protein